MRLPARRLPWARLLLLAEAAMGLKRSFEKLTPAERRELARIIRASRGRPGNLTAHEKSEVRRMVGKMEPGVLARDIAAGRARRGPRRA